MLTERAVALRVGGDRKVEKGGGRGWKKFEKGELRNIGEVFIKQGG